MSLMLQTIEGSHSAFSEDEANEALKSYQEGVELAIRANCSPEECHGMGIFHVMNFTAGLLLKHDIENKEYQNG